jgi:endoglucanase Acf2
MKMSLTVLFAVGIWAALARAQSIIPVGAGSYASYPPPQAGGTATSTINQPIYVVNTNGVPVPTNKWWTDDVVAQYAGNMWAYPLTVSASSHGINVYDPTNWGQSGTNPQLGVGTPISILGQGFSAASSPALRWGDWTLTFRLQQATNQFIDVTIGHGLPYVWTQFAGVQPAISLPGGATYFGDNGNAVSFPITTNHFGISALGQYWAVFAPDNTQFALSNSAINVTFAGTNQFLVMAVMPAQSNLTYFSQYAYALPTNSVMNWAYDPNAGAVTTSWHLATQPLQGSQPQLIQGWLAHHWRNTTNNLAFNGIQYSVARGLMKCATGTDFQIVYNFNGILPTLPAPQQLGLANDYDPTRMAWYLSNVGADTNVAPDTYWGGKDMLRYAQHMAFASQIGDTNFTTLENTTRQALTNWLTYTPNESTYYFASYPTWKALVGFEASYGSDQFNDQHFHYGYFTHAAALLGMYDQTFLTNFGPMLTLVAKEYANWDRTDTNFPLFRTFDIWSGHSQASGFPDATRGGNQESSSEACQSWGGLFLLGSMLGDSQMQAAGAMGYTMETTAVREYWFNAYGSNVWPAVYSQSVVGILWDNGMDHQTYFGLVPIYIHAIQWLPPSPIMSYLVRDPVFAQKDYNSMLAEQLAQQGVNTISSLGSEWGNYALAYAGQFNPDYTAAQMDQLWADDDDVAKDVTYAGVTYYQAHATRMLGSIQWNMHTSIPTSAVYYNTNTAQFSFIAYNPQPTQQVATIYSNNIPIGTMTVPAYSFVNQQTVGSVTFVTNIVPAVVAPGVAVSWPTMLASNYQPQSTAALSANTPWTNWGSQITGNGSTYSLFDPFGQNSQKFYQVLLFGTAPGTGVVSTAGNQLLNPGFESAGASTSSATNWTVPQAAGGPVYGVRTNDNPHSGSFNFEVHLASTGGGPVVQLQQSNVPVTGGVSYTFSFYADRLTGSAGDVDQYNIQWWGSGLISSTGFQSYTPGANAYAQTTITGLVAPTNATFATVIFYCAGAATPSQSATIDFDDVSLSNTNSGSSGGPGTITTTNGVQAAIATSAAITWFASNGVPYQVQSSTDQVNWNNLGSQITGTGASNTVYDTSGVIHSYQVLSIQRVVQAPQPVPTV